VLVAMTSALRVSVMVTVVPATHFARSSESIMFVNDTAYRAGACLSSAFDSLLESGFLTSLNVYRLITPS
jgi:hypothetical protein